MRSLGVDEDVLPPPGAERPQRLVESDTQRGQRILDARRHLPPSLTGRTLTVTANDGTRTERELADGAEVLRVLAADFGIRLPGDTRLPE